MPWTAAYVDSRTEPTVDLRSNIAAEARAKASKQLTDAEVTLMAARRHAPDRAVCGDPGMDGRESGDGSPGIDSTRNTYWT